MKIVNYKTSRLNRVFKILTIICIINMFISTRLETKLSQIDESEKVSQLETPTMIKSGLGSHSTLNADKFQTPIQLQETNKEQGFETPVFIHLNEKQVGNSDQISDHINSQPQPFNDSIKNLDENLKSDMKVLTSQLENTNDKNERIDICII